MENLVAALASLRAIDLVLARHRVLRSPLFFVLLWYAARVLQLREFSQKDFFALSLTNTSYDFRRAEEQGLLLSRASETDKRVRLYRLSPLGEQILAEIEEAVARSHLRRAA